MNNISKAKMFAIEKHLGQYDDDGKDYFTSHLFQVFKIIEIIATDDEGLLCAALLHDTIEDTDTTYEELLSLFGEDIANLVYEVTHEGEKDSKGFYFPRLKSQRAIVLKFADRLSNLSRMNNWDNKRKEQYLKKSKFWLSE